MFSDHPAFEMWCPYVPADGAAQFPMPSAQMCAPPLVSLPPASAASAQRTPGAPPPPDAPPAQSGATAEVRKSRRGGARPHPPRAPDKLTSEDERLLAWEMWGELSSLVPRVQHDGSLKMPAEKGSARVDGSAFRRAYPCLPFMQPAPAETRSLSILRGKLPVQKGGVRLPADRVRGCFEAEALGVCAPPPHTHPHLTQPHPTNHP